MPFMSNYFVKAAYLNLLTSCMLETAGNIEILLSIALYVGIIINCVHAGLKMKPPPATDDKKEEDKQPESSRMQDSSAHPLN